MLPSMLSTPLPATMRVEKATSHLLMGPDWTMNMDICDAINTDPLHAKDFVKAVKKRLQNKDPRVQFLALLLLETMIKNCGDFVHFQVVDREILQDMVKIVRKTTDIQVRDKILVLLESWQEAFGGPGGRYPQYYYAYAELKTSGMSFPQHQKDAALIYTHATPSYHPQVGYGILSSSVERVDEVRVSETGNFSLSDLNNIQSVMELFIDMLRAVNPEDHQAVNDEVITDLASQCRINQKKVMQMINSTENEELLGEALALHDNLQNALAKHDAIASGSPLPLETAHGLSTPVALLQSVSAVSQQFDGREVEEDGSTYLAHSDSKFKSTSAQQVSPNKGDSTITTSTSGALEATSSVASSALVLLDPPTPVSTFKKDDDMIDLLSLVLQTDSSPQMPAAPLPPSNQNQNPFSDSPSWQQYPNNPHPLMSNNGHVTYNSYVAPWAQSTVAQSPLPLPPTLPQQQVTQYPYNYQPQSWTSTPEFSSNPFLSTTSFQYPASQFTMAPATASTSSGPASTFQHPASQSTMAPAPTAPATSFQYPASQSTMAPAPAAPVPVQDSKAIQMYNPIGSKEIQVNTPVPVQDSKAIQMYNPIGSKEIQVNANNLKQTASSMSPKPYVMPDKLFEDLIELRNPDGSLKSRSASTLWGPAGQGMSNERK